MALGSELREVAAGLGFALCGVARAAPVADDGHLRAWLAAGHHGALGWLAERVEERLDPRMLRAGARSVVALGTFYGGPGEDPAPVAGRGRVARFARGRDYHNVLGRRIRKLRRWMLERSPGVPGYVSVDTGPVQERYWAWRAGLGGRSGHGGLIVPGRGSWLLLAVLIADAELPESSPVETPCDSCGRCLTACPTGALVAPGVVDARRCIAYLTIESHDPWPEELREQAGSRFFGCDACQEACPCAADAAAGDPALAELAGRRDLDLERVLGLDSRDALREWLQGSPLQRPGLAGLKRNALVVLGNQGDRGAVGSVARCLRSDPEPMVRGQAAWALGRLGGAAAAEALHGAARTEPVDAVLGDIQRAQERVT